MMVEYETEASYAQHTKNVLVTGPNGFVGRSVCQELTKREYVVRGALRKAKTIPNGCQSIVVGEINGQTDWDQALKDIDVVVHLAARVHVMNDNVVDPLAAFRKVNVEGTRQLAKFAAAASVKHFIYVSSIKANGEATQVNKPFSEIDEPGPKDYYGISKWEAEQVLRKIESVSDMAVTIFRPPLLYGPGVKANFLSLIKLADKRLPLPLGAITNKRSLLGLGNFVDLICYCIKHPASKGETFVVSDGHDLSTAELFSKIASALKKPARIFSVSPRILGMLGRIVRKQDIIKRLVGSLEINSTKVQKKLDWQPPFSVDDELVRTIDWYYDHKAGSVT